MSRDLSLGCFYALTGACIVACPSAWLEWALWAFLFDLAALGGVP